MFGKRKAAFFLCLISAISLFGCSNPKDEEKPPEPAQPYDGREYIRESELADYGDSDSYIDEYEPVLNPDSMLSVPTYITKVDDIWFIVDCYHNRVIYSSDLGSPLNSWLVMCPEVTQPHTMASDGKVYMIDDTENNRVLVYEKMKDKFIKTQIFSNVGNRPHFSVYDPVSDTFYVWSSQSGELYCFRHTEDSTRLYLTEIKK